MQKPSLLRFQFLREVPADNFEEPAYLRCVYAALEQVGNDDPPLFPSEHFSNKFDHLRVVHFSVPAVDLQRRIADAHQHILKVDG